MPLINLNDVLLDGDIAGQTFSVARSTEVLTRGVRSDTLAQFPGLRGAVQPATSQDLMRVPELENLDGAITIWSAFRFAKDDIATWNGDDYLVKSADDWTQFGGGFMRATCKLLKTT